MNFCSKFTLKGIISTQTMENFNCFFHWLSLINKLVLCSAGLHVTKLKWLSSCMSATEYLTHSVAPLAFT